MIRGNSKGNDIRDLLLRCGRIPECEDRFPAAIEVFVDSYRSFDSRSIRPSDAVLFARSQEAKGTYQRIIEFEREKWKRVFAAVPGISSGTVSRHTNPPGRADVEDFERLRLQQRHGKKKSEHKPECSLHIDPSSSILPEWRVQQKMRDKEDESLRGS